MSDIAQPTPQVLASEQADEVTFEQLMAEARRLNDLMQQDRTEIVRLRGETWELRAETRALLAEIGARL